MIKLICGAAAAVALIVAAFIAFTMSITGRVLTPSVRRELLELEAFLRSLAAAFRRQRSFFPHPLIRHPGIDYEIA